MRADRLRPWLLGAATALWVARLLFPSDSVASLGDGLPAVMLWIVLAVVWLLGAIGQPRFRLRFGWIDAAVLLLVAWHTVAAIWAATHLSPRPAVNMLWEWVGLGVSFFLARQLIVGLREARAVAAVMCSMAMALAAYGLYQYAYEMPATRAEYQADPDRALAEANLWSPRGSPERRLFENRLESVEPTATFALTNSLAGFLAPWLVLLAAAIVGHVSNVPRARRLGLRPDPASVGTESQPTSPRSHAPRGNGLLAALRPWLSRRRAAGLALPRGAWERGARGAWQRGAPVACALIVAACLLLTKSRTACLAVLFGLTLVGLTLRGKSVSIPWKYAAWVAAAGTALVVAAVAVGGVDREVFSEAGKSLGYRGQYWRSSLAMIADHPLLGCGPGNFQDAYKLYKLPDASEEIADPHNFLFEIWATAGTPAVLALAAVFVGFFVIVLKTPVEWLSESSETSEASATSQRLFQNSRSTSVPLVPNAKSPSKRDACSTNSTFGTDSQPSEPSKTAPRAILPVYGGALLGFAAAGVIGVLSPAPPTLTVLGVVVPAASLAAAGLWNWVARGNLSARLAAIGVAVLLVDLSAAGGIRYAGVAGSLWLLMAIGLNANECSRINLPGWVAFVLLAITGGVAYGCYATAYRPVLRSHAAIDRAQRDPLLAEKHLLDAAAADPMSADPWNQLASRAIAEWISSSSGDSLHQFERYNGEALRRAPNSAPIWAAAGDRYLEIYQRTKQSGYLQKAVAALRRVVELYPNSATDRAKLAIALRIAGDEPGYELQRERALWLDQTTPHLDKKLDEKLRAELRTSLERSNSRRRTAGDTP